MKQGFLESIPNFPINIYDLKEKSGRREYSLELFLHLIGGRGKVIKFEIYVTTIRASPQPIFLSHFHPFSMRHTPQPIFLSRFHPFSMIHIKLTRKVHDAS
jgi:hypothetical protein